jgi:hypothetical protein
MQSKAYPNSTPEFRILEKLDGTSEMQVRYINRPINYIGKWAPIPIEKEQAESKK